MSLDFTTSFGGNFVDTVTTTVKFVDFLGEETTILSLTESPSFADTGGTTFKPTSAASPPERDTLSFCNETCQFGGKSFFTKI